MLDSLADTVARARVREARAGSTLASDTVVAFEALAFTSGAIARTLVGTFHIVVSRVSDDLQIGILHLRELFGGTVWVNETVVNDDLVSVR